MYNQASWGGKMKFTTFSLKFAVSLLSVCLVSTYVGGDLLIHNDPTNTSQKIGPDGEKFKLALEVICDEKRGFCELKRVMVDQQEETYVTVSSPSISQKGIHSPGFVKTYYLRKTDNFNMRSHIKIADSPPPIIG